MATREEIIRDLRRQDMIADMRRMDAMEASAPKSDMVNDEMPEWLNDSDRLKAKNLTNNEDEQVAFLQKQYPDSEVKKQGDRVLLRKKGESAYGVLDPSFSFRKNWLQEGLRDTGDIIGDIGQGISEGVGAAAGAATGSVTLPGAGTIGGAMLGSGIASGAFSDAKERLAAMLNVKDYDGKKVLSDAAWGAATPGVMTAGGKALKWGAQKALPSVYAKATGLTTEALKRIADKGDELSKWTEVDALKKLTGIGDDVASHIKTKKAEFAKQYQALRGLDADVDTGSVVRLLDDEIAKASAQAQANPGISAFQDQVDELVKMKGDIFSNNVTPLKTNINDAIDLDGRISEKYIDWSPDAGQGVGTGNTVSAQQERLARLLRDKLRGNVDDGAAGLKSGVDGEYSKFVDQVNYLRKNFKDPKKTQGTLKALGDGKDISLIGGFQGLDDSLIKQINQSKGDIDLYRYFQPTNNSILTEQGLKDMAVGRAPIEKLLTALGTGAGYVSGGAVGGVIGAGAGRLTGKAIASPGSVKAITKLAKKTGLGMDGIEELLKQNPSILQSLYGGTAAAAQD